MESEAPVLEIRNLYKDFPLTRKQQTERRVSTPVLRAVNDLSFSLYPGKIYGLLGPNGAGKTTTLRMVATLLSPTSGNILFHDKSIFDDLDGYRKKVGFLTSELKLDDFFTPSYTFDYMTALYGLDKAEAEKRKQQIFDAFGISRFSLSPIKTLSTGMKQKVSLAISIAHDPEVIIYDEPTNGLDILASRDVENFLINLKNDGKTIVISTHIFSLVEKLCDEVGIILEGKMALQGSLGEVTKEKSLEEVFFSLVEEER